MSVKGMVDVYLGSVTQGITFVLGKFAVVSFLFVLNTVLKKQFCALIVYSLEGQPSLN